MRTGLAIGGVAMLGVAAVIGFGVFDTETSDATDTVTAKVATIAVDNGGGDVVLRAAPVDHTTVQRHIEFRGFGSPDKGFEMAGDTLRLNGCGDLCSVDYTVTVPTGAQVTGDIGSGDTTIDGLGSVHLGSGSGKVVLRNVHDADVHNGSGDIEVTGAAGPVTAHSGSGRVRVSGVNGRVQVGSGSGDLFATDIHGPVDAQASSGDVEVASTVGADVRAVSSSGDVSVRVPGTVRYRVDASRSNGSVDGSVATDPNAPFSLTAQSSSGDVTLATS